MNAHKQYIKENVLKITANFVSILNNSRYYYGTRMKHQHANDLPLVADSEIADGEQSTAQKK